jgi:hypothetical protein
VTKEAYLLFNYILVIIIGFSLIILITIPTNKSIQCSYKSKRSITCPSCGFTRDFKTIIRVGYKKDQMINRNSISIFSFFSIQLLLRIALAVFINSFKTQKNLKTILSIDFLISVFVFTILFHQLIISIHKS